MARTNIVAQTLLGAYPSLPISVGGAEPSLTSTGDPTDRSTAIIDGKTLVMAFNSEAVTAHTITFTSVVDTPFNRAGDITAYSLDAGDIALFGPFKLAGWSNAGVLFIDVSDSHIQLAVITLP